ncbi:MAG TPA: SUMF1/EgtB/PvdO family nonheme iron enzyme [Pontiellaceae bacterium]|nr:SUMF1/EgtB/PvdO family nonheme iron enzyme [Pontiellaceae bacterium]
MRLYKAGIWITVWMLCAAAQADVITHGGMAVGMEFVAVGGAGNAADTGGYGAVGYNYRIGRYEVSANQWGAVAAAAGIGETGVWSGSQPVASVSWYDAAQFCNWLTSGNKYLGAYQFSGSGTLTNVNRSSSVSIYGMTYVLPTEDEWYKAAYYTGSGYSLYANGTGTEPAAGTDSRYKGYSSPWTVGSGTVEQNGTFDMMGNVWELNESALDGVLDSMSETRLARGGSFGSTGDRLLPDERWEISPSGETDYIGFRVAAVPNPAAVPEPAAAMLIFFGSAAGFWVRRRFYD